MNPFPDVAPHLIARGYRPVPIKAGEKFPPMKAWQKYEFDAAVAQRFKSCGTGLLCGEILGIDLDIPDAVTMGAMAKWIVQRFGRAPIRFGNKPKALLLYRAAEPDMRKQQTVEYLQGERKAKVEILATGQQFVAFHIHPSTGKPYEWHNGSPLNTPVDDLKPLNDSDVGEIIAYADQLLTTWGVPAKVTKPAKPPSPDALPKRAATAAVCPDDLSAGLEHSRPSRIEMLETLTELADFDQGDYDTWMRVGAALHHETNGSDEGLELFTAYSRCLTGFYAGDQAGEAGCVAKWASFGRSGNKPITWGSVIFILHGLKEARK